MSIESSLSAAGENDCAAAVEAKRPKYNSDALHVRLKTARIGIPRRQVVVCIIF